MTTNDFFDARFWILIWSGLYLIEAFLDYSYSSQGWKYGFFETNPFHLWRDKYGFYRAAPQIIAEAIFLAAITALAFLVNPGISWALAALGIYGTLHIFTKTAKDMRYVRGNQITFLQQAREGMFPSGLAAGALDNPNPIVTKADRSWYKYAPWIWTNLKPDITQLNEDGVPLYQAALRAKLTDFAQNVREADWFNQPHP